MLASVNILKLNVDLFRLVEVCMKNPTCTLYGARFCNVLFDVKSCYWKSLCKMPSALIRLNIFHLLSYEQNLLPNRIAGKLMNIKKIKLLDNDIKMQLLISNRYDALDNICKTGDQTWKIHSTYHILITKITILEINQVS